MPLGAREVERTAEGLDHSPAQRQAETVALAVFAGLAMELDKGLKRVVDSIGWDADAAVNDLDRDEVVIATRAHEHRTAHRSEPEGVVDETAKDVLQTVFVDGDGWKALRNLGPQPQTFVLGDRSPF